MIMSMSENHELGILVLMSMSQLTTLVSEFMNFRRFVEIPILKNKFSTHCY